MAIPVSIAPKLESASKDIIRAEREFKATKNLDDLQSTISDCLYKLHLSLDRTQNKIWEKYNSKLPDKEKANIYFPLAETKQKLSDRLKKDQLEELESRCSEIYEALVSVQPFSGSVWWQKMYWLTRTRHERDAELVSTVTRGTGIGRGQDLYIKSLTTGSDGQISFEGNAWNQTTGKPEPVRVEDYLTEKIALKVLDLEALPFARLCLSETQKLIQSVFRLI